MLYNYSFKAYFLYSGFNVTLLNSVIPSSVTLYNSLPRKAGHKKHLSVRINTTQRCLEMYLGSDIEIDPINYLRAAQYFSKVLSLQPGMGSYIVDGRLLIQ